MLSKREDELLSDALAILSEHFPNYAVAVLSEDEAFLHCDYSCWRVGRMLFRDALEDMEQDMGANMETFDWDEDDEEDYE